MYKLLFAIVGSFLLSVHGKCPKDIASLRSPYVASSFDANKLSGFFYEIAFEDILQTGETCQWFNETIVSNGISEQFGFTYNKPASTSVSFENTDVNGVYMKYMGDSETAMPTVVVDVILNSEGMYEAVTEYTCYADGLKTYEEIKIGSRTASVSEETMNEILKGLNNAGISTDGLVYVDQTGCEYNI